MEFDCDVALMMPNGQLTASTPVSIRFVADGDAIRDIHVIDTGGILYPGGNMKVVKTADAIKLEGVPVPPERPGQWSGTVEKKMYRMKLTAGALAEAVTIGLGREPSEKSGRYGLVWNATNQPEGMPSPLSGTGAGNCARRQGSGQ